MVFFPVTKSYCFFNEQLNLISLSSTIFSFLILVLHFPLKILNIQPQTSVTISVSKCSNTSSFWFAFWLSARKASLLLILMTHRIIQSKNWNQLCYPLTRHVS